VEPGLYVHHKGGQYLVLMTAFESGNGRPREEVVVYVSLKHTSINVRPLKEFIALVEWQDGSLRPRFTRVV